MSTDFMIQLITLFLDIALFSVYLLVICRKKPRRSGFYRRLPLLMLLEAALCVPLAAFRATHDTLQARILVELLFSAIQIIAMPILYKGSVSQYFLWFSGVLMTKNFSGNTLQLLLNLFGIDDTKTISFFPGGNTMLPDWLIYAAIHIALLLIITGIFEQGEKAGVTLSGFSVIWLAATTLTLRCIVQPYIRVNQPFDGNMLICVRALMLMIYLMLIAIRGGLLSQKKAEAELEAGEELLRAERKRYAEMRDTIELVNMRFHDLKRHLDDLQGRLTQEEISAISEAMELYDGAIRTGSEIVDTVLCQKKLVCDKHGVALSSVCNGAAVRFMEPSKLYSLLDNALENAIEAVTALPKDERLISLSISEENGGARIEVSNYFDPSVAVENGTSKSDKSRHGYGLKSMRYIAESCGGEVYTEKSDNMFFLTITLPNK
ncbi:MAG: sensor histidine kinase [Oscillospiraceae bacterium]|nr:sensor histidine kinase [Oscillospiraceae bacterium]